MEIDSAEFEYIKAYLQRAASDEAAAEPAATPGAAGTKHRRSSEEAAAFSPLVDDDDASDSGTKRRRKVAWTNTEDLVIMAAVRRIGTQWDRIAEHLPGRTGDAVRNRWHRLQKTHPLAADTDECRSAIYVVGRAFGNVDDAPAKLVNGSL